MDILLETSNESDSLRRVVDACDDTSWYLSALADTSHDVALRQNASAMAEECQELAVELVELGMVFDPTLAVRRMEGVYERNIAATRAMLTTQPDPVSLLGECARVQSILIQRYQELARTSIPARWRPLLEDHQERLRRSLLGAAC